MLTYKVRVQVDARSDLNLDCHHFSSLKLLQRFFLKKQDLALKSVLDYDWGSMSV